jgi:hypothetical protein
MPDTVVMAALLRAKDVRCRNSPHAALHAIRQARCAAGTAGVGLALSHVRGFPA